MCAHSAGASTRDDSMAPYLVSKKPREVSPKHSVMSELQTRAACDKFDVTVWDLCWMLFCSFMLTSGLRLDEPTITAERFHCFF